MCCEKMKYKIMNITAYYDSMVNLFLWLLPFVLFFIAFPSTSQTSVPKTTLTVPRLSTTPRPNTQFDCGFDADLCGWRQLKG